MIYFDRDGTRRPLCSLQATINIRAHLEDQLAFLGVKRCEPEVIYISRAQRETLLNMKLGQQLLIGLLFYFEKLGQCSALLTHCQNKRLQSRAMCISTFSDLEGDSLSSARGTDLVDLN